MTQFNTPYEAKQYYEWRGVGRFWLKDEGSFDGDFPSLPQDPEDQSKENSLAAHIIETVFDLELDVEDKSKYGSYLPGYDVKNRDAYQMVQLSLAYEMSDLKFVECYADPEGLVRFYTIGEERADLDNYILKSITTSTLKQKCDNVLVVGYDPPQKKFIRYRVGGDNTESPPDIKMEHDDLDTNDNELGIDMFTFAREIDQYTYEYYEYLYGEDAAQLVKVDTDYPKYWAFSSYLEPELCSYAREGCIEFRDPLITDERYLEQAGILFSRKFEKIAGWLYSIEIPFFKQESTEVEFNQKSIRYYDLKSMGDLQQITFKKDDRYIPKLCAEVDDIDVTKGVKLPDSENPQFLGVREVYIYGYELKQITMDEMYDPNNPDNTLPGLADFVVDLNTLSSEPFKLSDGQDYVVVKNPKDITEGEDGGGYKIIFAANISPTFEEMFGGTVGYSENELENFRRFRISPSSLYRDPEEEGLELIDADVCNVKDYFKPGTSIRYLDCTGDLKDGTPDISSTDIYYGCIFPMGEGNAGYVVEKLVVVYEWDNPSVIVRDLDDQITEDNLKAISVRMYPVVNQDLPPPIAHKSRDQNAVLLDPRQQIPDLDPGSVQNLYDTEYQRALNEIENGDVKINLPFIGVNGYPWEGGFRSGGVGAAKLKNVAEFIYELQNEEIEETTYVCTPGATPKLGQTIEGKTINSIDYSYQDSSQFLISVNAGPVWRGMGGWSTSVYQNQTERVQLEGVIRKVNADDTSCLVQLERIGLMECVNGQTDKLEVGDTVKVTVHNNPVSR